jgi:hypothetical protein
MFGGFPPSRGGSVPWWFGTLCQDSFAPLHKFGVFRWAITRHESEYPTLSVSQPRRPLSRCLVPSCYLTQTRSTVLPLLRRLQTMFRMFRATFWPGPAPVWLALAIALVESECTVMCCCLAPWNQSTTRSMAASSASKAVCWSPILRAPWAMGEGALSLVVRSYDPSEACSPTKGPVCPRVAPLLAAPPGLRPGGFQSQLRGTYLDLTAFLDS